VDAVQPCKSTYDFEVWRYTESGPKEKPSIQPVTKPRPKYITPYNRLVGALTVTQMRRKQINCSVDNTMVQTYLDASGATCQSTDEIDANPYSLDPTFQRFSEVYNGKLDVSSTYFDNERADDKDKSPYAFFPHEHDALKSVPRTTQIKRSVLGPRKLTIEKQSVDHAKDAKYTHQPSKNLFKVYFDELPTGKQADRMLSFLKDGKFIDSKTDGITVEMVVYNAQQVTVYVHFFCVCVCACAVCCVCVCALSVCVCVLFHVCNTNSYKCICTFESQASSTVKQAPSQNM
jgi:hypothetical protein